jgi:hypothetical protein
MTLRPANRLDLRNALPEITDLAGRALVVFAAVIDRVVVAVATLVRTVTEWAADTRTARLIIAVAGQPLATILTFNARSTSRTCGIDALRILTGAVYTLAAGLQHTVTIRAATRCRVVALVRRLTASRAAAAADRLAEP